MRGALAVVVFPAVVIACATQQQPAAPPHIDEMRARELVVKQYTELFRNAYMKQESADEYERYPALETKDFTYAEFRGDAWLVQMNPPDGFFVRARVGAQGEWVEFTGVGFNPW